MQARSEDACKAVRPLAVSRGWLRVGDRVSVGLLGSLGALSPAQTSALVSGGGGAQEGTFGDELLPAEPKAWLTFTQKHKGSI